MVNSTLATESVQPNTLPSTKDARPKLKRRGLLREILETVLLVAAIYALVNLATARFIVDGASMQPNFATGQFLIVSRVNYLFSEPEYGDIIVFHEPRREEDDYIKRVIGLPGDTIEIREAQVYVNGGLIDEPYINNTKTCFGDCAWTLTGDEYFVMGDNRQHSSDSRAFGPVERRLIVGEALVRYWPPSKWGIVEKIRFPQSNTVLAD